MARVAKKSTSYEPAGRVTSAFFGSECDDYEELPYRTKRSKVVIKTGSVCNPACKVQMKKVPNGTSKYSIRNSS